MARTDLDRIERILHDERREVVKIDRELDIIKHEVVDRTPSNFSAKDIVRSFFGALIVAFGFIFGGAFVSTSVRMQNHNLAAIIICSIVILIFEIYYFGYRKIPDKEERRFGQFVMKRLPTFYLVSLVVAAGLVFLYGIDKSPLIGSGNDLFKVILSVSFPASIGAGLSDLIKRY